MFETIEKLRAKPEGAKKRFAFFVAFSFCALIFTVWVTAIYPTLGKEDENLATATSTSPVSSIADLVGTGVDSFKSQISEMTDNIKSITSSQEYYSATSTQATSTSSVNTANVYNSIGN